MQFKSHFQKPVVFICAVMGTVPGIVGNLLFWNDQRWSGL